MTAGNAPRRAAVAGCMDDEPILLAEMDAFDLRHAIADGLTMGDGLRVDVIDENTLMVIGFDPMSNRRGIYLATGRLLHLTRDGRGEPWWAEHQAGNGTTGVFDSHRMKATLSDLAEDLAWVRRRSDP